MVYNNFLNSTVKQDLPAHIGPGDLAIRLTISQFHRNATNPHLSSYAEA